MAKPYTKLQFVKQTSKLYGNYACCLAFLFQSPSALGLAMTAILIHGITLYIGHAT